MGLSLSKLWLYPQALLAVEGKWGVGEKRVFVSPGNSPSCMALPEDENVSKCSWQWAAPWEERRAGAAGRPGKDVRTCLPPPDQFRPQVARELAIPFLNPPCKSLTELTLLSTWCFLSPTFLWDKNYFCPFYRWETSKKFKAIPHSHPICVQHGQDSNLHLSDFKARCFPL